MATDIATRVYNHTFRIDPAIRTLLDTDFYKLLMLQMIWKMHPRREVTFQLINRTASVRLAEIVDEKELIDQLDHARTLRFAKNELIWLAGNTFYGARHIFEPDFMEWLSAFQLPEYELTRRDGQYELQFAGPWTHTTMWEIPALAIINELRARAAMRSMSRFDLDVLYARAKAKLWSKVERLRRLEREGPLRISDFGTRRRHGFLWQRWCVEALQEGLGESFIGTSNVKHAMDTGLEAIGTNAHELPMVYAAIARDDEELRAAPYQVLEGLGADVRRQSAGRSARLLRHDVVSARCARLGRRLEGRPARLQAADRGRARAHRLVEGEGTRSARQAHRVVRRDGHRLDRSFRPGAARRGQSVVRLGHQPHQRLPRLRAGRSRRAAPCDLARLQGRRG